MCLEKMKGPRLAACLVDEWADQWVQRMVALSAESSAVLKVSAMVVTLVEWRVVHSVGQSVESSAHV